MGNKRFALKGVDESLDGLTYDTLNQESRRTLDDSLLHTIFRANRICPIATEAVSTEYSSG